MTPRYVCGDIYMEHSTYAHCKKFPPNAESTWETDGKEKEGKKGEGREDRGSTGKEYTPMQDATRQGKILSFFLLKRKESCARKRGVGEKEGRGEEEKCLTFFTCIINSLSALVLNVYNRNTALLLLE